MNEQAAENLCDAIEILYAITPPPSDGSVDHLIAKFEHQLDTITAQSPVMVMETDE